jgi:hypothetical protein
LQEPLFLVILLVVAAASYFVRARSIPSGRWVRGDSLYHLFVAREVRRLGGLPDRIGRFYLPEVYSYPPLHHLVVSRVPGSRDMQTQRIGFAYDAITAFLVGCAGYALAGWEVGLLAPVIYAASPFPFATCLATSPQPLGVMFVSLFALASIEVPSAPGLAAALPLVALSGLSAAGATLSHRSTAQAMLGLVAAETLLFRSPDFVELFLLGLVLSLLLLRGRFVRQVREHVLFVSSLARYQLRRFSELWKRRDLGGVLDEHFTPRAVLVNFPLLLIVPALLPFEAGAPLPLLAWAAGVAAMYLLWFPGKGYRHLAAAVPPLSILGAWVVARYPPWGLAILGVPLALAVRRYLKSVLPGKMFATDDELSACAALDRIAAEGDLVWGIPPDELYALLYFTRAKILRGSGGDPRGLLFNRKLQQMELGQDGGSRIVQEYRPRFVLRRKGSTPDVPGTVAFENGGFQVIQLADPGGPVTAG